MKSLGKFLKIKLIFYLNSLGEYNCDEAVDCVKRIKFNC